VPVHAYEAVVQSRNPDIGPVALAATERAVVTAAKAALKPYLTLEAIASRQDRSTELETELLELRIVLLPLLDALTPFERRVIGARTGWDGSAPETLQAVGERLGVTRERVRQLESKGLKRMRRIARNHHLKAEDLGIVGRLLPVADDIDDPSADPEGKKEGRPGSVKHPGQPDVSGARAPKGGYPRPTKRETDLIRANRLRTMQARRFRERGEGPKVSAVAGPPVPNQSTPAERPASILHTVQDQMTAALLASDVRLAGVGGWRVEQGFIPAPSKLSPLERAAVEEARRRVLGSARKIQ